MESGIRSTNYISLSFVSVTGMHRFQVTFGLDAVMIFGDLHPVYKNITITHSVE